jgi:hypothetical protein
MKQVIVWTALPYGTNPAGTKLRLSALVAPRLDSSPAAVGTLGDFPDFVSWPAQAIDFAVSFNGAAPVAAVRTSPPPDSGAWASLFTASLAVTGFIPDDYTAQTIHSYPVGNVVGFLKEQYGRIGAASPNDVPFIPIILERGFRRIATIQGTQREVSDVTPQREKLLATRLGTAKALAPAAPEPELDFFRAKHFHEFRGGDRTVPVEPPEFDFHQALSLLASHPVLLRRLGLIVELEVPAAGVAKSGTLRLVVHRTVRAGDEDRSPLTAYELDTAKRVFLPAPKPGSALAGGMLDLTRAEFGLQQVDADGAALRAVDFANQLVLIAAQHRRTADSPTDAGLPALRSGGISLIHTGRALSQVGEFSDLLKLAGEIASGAAPPTLHADDVTQGWRIDVEQEGGGVWRSLCERDITYQFVRPNSPAPVTEQDEAVVTTALTSDTTSAAPAELFLHEALFHWDGWSLGGPRPGEAIQPDGLKHAEQQDNPSKSQLELSIVSKVVPGTLPRLRIGSSYRLRARAVDAAGRSLPRVTKDDSRATPALVYRRFEPLEAPAIMWLRTVDPADLPGESNARLVIRSANAGEAQDGLVSPELSERLIAPPKTSVTMAEQLGKLDMAGGVDGSAATWARLAAKDPGVLPEHGTAPPAPFPYLPDPLAVASALRGLPGMPADGVLVTSFETAGDWMEPSPYRLALMEGSGAPLWDPATRTLTVLLSKAQVMKVRLSSVLAAADLDRMAMWHWIADAAFDAEAVARLRKLAESGSHWMITPFRELTLVHAVLQPLAPPVIHDVVPTRSLGATYALLAGVIGIHGASTGKADLLASWSEPTGEGFARRDGNAHVFEVPVHDAAAVTVDLEQRRHEFGDTRHRRVRYSARATSRFREYFPASVTADPLKLQRASLAELEVDVLSSARPLAPSIVYVIPTFGWESGADATAAYSRRTTGLRVYLESPWFSTGDGELLGVTMWLGPTDFCGAQATPPPQLPIPQHFPDSLKPYATRWGRDPIWSSGNPHPLPTLEHFPRAVAVEAGLTIGERPDAVLAVAGHEVGYDPDRKLFYCDIDIDAGDAYYPFIRMALARYQPKSVQDAELSRVVLAEFIQLAPGRMAWIARDPEQPARLAITVSGRGYRRNASFPCSSQVEVRIERFLGEDEGAIGWVPVSVEPESLADTQVLPGQTAWTGTLTLPADGPDARFRLIVEEYEYFLGDDPAFSAPEGRPFGQDRERRLVYADAIEVAAL